MGLFCDFYKLGQEEGRVIALQIIFDLVFLFGLKYFENGEELEVTESGDENDEITKEKAKVMNIISSALYDSDEKIQNTASEGFSKLFLNRVIDDRQVLEGLFYLYLHPATPASSPIKQCLSYFFQAYAFISSDNQLAIGSLVGKIIGSWVRISKQQQQNEQAVNISLNSVAGQLLYLIDRNNLIQSASKSSLESYNEMYAQIAVDLSWVILNDPQDESAKTISSIIWKLPLKSLNRPDAPPLLKQLLFLQTQIMKYLPDKTTLNMLKRCTANLLQLDNQEMPLDFEIINEMRAQLQNILPAGIKVNQNTTALSTAKKSKLTIPNQESTGNIMDDITDLLEDD